MFFRSLIVLVLLVLTAALAGCGSEAPERGTGWTRTSRAELTADAQSQARTALAARDALFQSLSGRLKVAMQEGGPREAIEVCRTEAARLTEAAASSQAVSIGRTSFRLRNPDNVPPDWARDLVDARTPDNAWLVHADGRLAGLLPIRLGSACLACHGPAAGISEAVKQALAAGYPADEATGFAAGDLRGWFWVEVPSP